MFIMYLNQGKKMNQELKIIKWTLNLQKRSRKNRFKELKNKGLI